MLVEGVLLIIYIIYMTFLPCFVLVRWIRRLINPPPPSRLRMEEMIPGKRYYTTGDHHDPDIHGRILDLYSSHMRERHPPGMVLPGKGLPLDIAAVILTDEEISIRCGDMSIEQLRGKLIELNADPASRATSKTTFHSTPRVDKYNYNYEAMDRANEARARTDPRSCYMIRPVILPEESADAKLSENQIIDRWLQFFIDGNYTFNTAYAWSCAGAWRAAGRRPSYWHPTMCHTLRNHVFESTEIITLNGQATKIIRSPNSIMPRRIWDVCANRVIPFEWVYHRTHTFWAVSHSWTDDIEPVWTDANERLWPIPMPRGVRLEDIRNELLSLNARYCWLDVLCLRQVNPSGDSDMEQCRLDEWKVDVPAIGNVYIHCRRVVTWFNGLGIPFAPEKWKADDKRHWANRAWTLQETMAVQNVVLGGVPQDLKKPFDIVIPAQPQGTTIKSLLESETKRLGRVPDPWEESKRDLTENNTNLPQLKDPRLLPWLLTEMNRRHASNPVDKIAGLMYLTLAGFYERYEPRPLSGVEVKERFLKFTIGYRIPTYEPSDTPAIAWKRFLLHKGHDGLLLTRPTIYAVSLLTTFPHPSAEHWFPSWDQITQYPKISQTELQVSLPLGADGVDEYAPSTRIGFGRIVRACSLSPITHHSTTAPQHHSLKLRAPDGRETIIHASKRAFGNEIPPQLRESRYTVFLPDPPCKQYNRQKETSVVLCREVRRQQQDLPEGNKQGGEIKLYLQKVASVSWTLGQSGMQEWYSAKPEEIASHHDIWLY